jgi:hypothetical protein
MTLTRITSPFVFSASITWISAMVVPSTTSFSIVARPTQRLLECPRVIEEALEVEALAIDVLNIVREEVTAKALDFLFRV